MKNVISPWIRAVVLGAVFVAASVSHAATVLYQAVDLPDVIGTEDLWRYDYKVTGDFEPFGGFTLLYDPATYAALSDAQPGASSDWDLSLVQPNPALPASGLFTATRLTAGAALNTPFSVQFVKLGAASPGAQPFEVFNSSFDTTEVGITQAVPEPETYVLFALGLLAIAARVSRR